MDAEIEALAARQHGLVTWHQALALGLTRSAIAHRLARGRWQRVWPGVYRLAAAPVTCHQQLLAAVLAAGDGAVASRRSAAALFEIPGLRTDILEITLPRGATPSLVGVLTHESLWLPSEHVTAVAGIPTTSLPRTLFDLAGSERRERVERALDNCLSRRLVTPNALWCVHTELEERGRAGTRVMRELLEARGDGYVAPASELEKRLLDILSDAGLPVPAREINVGDDDRWVGRVELVYREAKVLIEADSRLHHSSLLDRASDLARDNRLMAAGWRVLRFDWDTIINRPHEVVALVRTALGRAAA